MFQLLNVIYSVIPYWYNPDIHNMGNIGFSGKMHAITTPLFTKLIDKIAYEGVDIRKQIYDTLEGDVLDICCGTGFSTKPGSIGIDTSREMLKYANLYNPGSSYIFGNAETFGKTNQFDTVSCMFAFHEIPKEGHIAIIENCIRVARKKVIIVDISTTYNPSELMLSGEPYIKDYINDVDATLYDFEKKSIIEKHVDMWVYQKSSNALL